MYPGVGARAGALAFGVEVCSPTVFALWRSWVQALEASPGPVFWNHP